MPRFLTGSRVYLRRKGTKVYDDINKEESKI